MLGWLRLFLLAAPLSSAFRLFCGSALGFLSRSEIEFVIQLGVGILLIRQNILKFDFTEEDTLADKVVVHLSVLSPGMEDGFFANWMLLRLS